ncbi:MAG TPA: hypothetical protein VGS22_09470 [Thermoanaerobaculia bacterium]|jgi:hypothetical protein|nr:hypothetical protein [Thermoanaerobaculia bacterium]
MLYRRGRRWTVFALSFLSFATWGPSAVRAGAVDNLSPIVELTSEGIAERHFDIFFCDVCDRTDRIFQLRHVTVFADRSVVLELTRNNLDDSHDTTTTVATGVGPPAAFDELRSALAAAPLPSQNGDCFLKITKRLPSPRPDSIVTESSRDQFTLHTFGPDNRIDRLALNPSAAGPCVPNLGRAVLAILDYATTATGAGARAYSKPAN